MNAVPFDTLKMAQRLEDAGFSRTQAAGAAEALAEALLGANLANKADIGSVRADIGSVKADIGSVKTDVKADIESVRMEIAKSETRMEERITTAIEMLRRDLTIKLGSMLIVAVGILLAAIRYLPPHP